MSFPVGTPELADFSNKLKIAFPEGFSEVGPQKQVFPSEIAKNFIRFTEFEVRSDDVFICSFPRSGTTWTCEIVWLLKHNLDFDTARANGFWERYPNLANHCGGFAYKDLDNLESPRVFMAHAPYEMLPTQIFSKKPKMIVVMREPKDVCVSYFHMLSKLFGYDGDMESFCNEFLHDRVLNGPYWSLVNSYWPMQHADNFLVTTYEDISKDLPATVKILANFLDTPVNESEVASICSHVTFSSMVKDPNFSMEGPGRESLEEKYNKKLGDGIFLRKGKSGSGKEEMSEETVKKFDKWIHENKLTW